MAVSRMLFQKFQFVDYGMLSWFRGVKMKKKSSGESDVDNGESNSKSSLTSKDLFLDSTLHLLYFLRLILQTFTPVVLVLVLSDNVLAGPITIGFVVISSCFPPQLPTSFTSQLRTPRMLEHAQYIFWVLTGATFVAMHALACGFSFVCTARQWGAARPALEFAFSAGISLYLLITLKTDTPVRRLFDIEWPRNNTD